MLPRTDILMRLAENAFRSSGAIAQGVRLASLEIDRDDYRWETRFRARLSTATPVGWIVSDYDDPASRRRIDYFGIDFLTDQFRRLVDRLVAELPILAQLTAVQDELELHVRWATVPPDRGVVRRAHETIRGLQEQLARLWDDRPRLPPVFVEHEIPVGEVLTVGITYIEPPRQLRAELAVPPLDTIEYMRFVREAYDDLMRGIPNESASQRAEGLLLAWLTPKQRHEYHRYKSFDVVGSHTGARYKINCQKCSYNVRDIVGGFDLCFGPREVLPAGDTYLAQKLALELHEEEALRVANTNEIFPERHWVFTRREMRWGGGPWWPGQAQF